MRHETGSESVASDSRENRSNGLMHSQCIEPCSLNHVNGNYILLIVCYFLVQRGMLFGESMVVLTPDLKCL